MLSFHAEGSLLLEIVLQMVFALYELACPVCVFLSVEDCIPQPTEGGRQAGWMFCVFPPQFFFFFFAKMREDDEWNRFDRRPPQPILQGDLPPSFPALRVSINEIGWTGLIFVGAQWSILCSLAGIRGPLCRD